MLSRESTSACTVTFLTEASQKSKATSAGGVGYRFRSRLARTPAELILVVTVLLWSGSYTSTRYAVTHGFEPIAFSSLRFAIGTVIFVAVVLIREGSIRIERRDLLYLVPAALIGVVINQVSFTYSISLATAATVALIFGTLPIFTSILTRILGWEQLTRRHWVATGVSFAGVALVALGVGGQLSADLGGVLLALLASASFAAFSVFSGRLMQSYSAYRVSALVVLVGAVPLLLISSPQVARLDWTGLDPLAWAAFAYIVFMFITTTYLWFIAVDRVGAAQGTLWANLQPFLGALVAVVILSEGLGLFQILGGVVIAISIVLGRIRRQPVPAPIE